MTYASSSSALASRQAEWNLPLNAHPADHDAVMTFVALLAARRANDSAGHRAAVRRLRAAGLSVALISPEAQAIHDRSGVGR